VSAVPPLPPAARVVEPVTMPTRRTTVPAHEPHTLPGWVAAVIYLACVVVMAWVLVRMV
jgi:hypothetical protein